MDFPITSKQDRRKYRELVHRALERESKAFIEKVQALASKEFSAEELSSGYQEKDGFALKGPYTKRYNQIYATVKEYDKYVFRNYDGINSIGHNFDRVFYLYREGILTDEDISELSEVEVNRLKARKSLLDEISSM